MLCLLDNMFVIMVMLILQPSFNGMTARYCAHGLVVCTQAHCALAYNVCSRSGAGQAAALGVGLFVFTDKMQTLLDATELPDGYTVRALSTYVPAVCTSAPSACTQMLISTRRE